MVPAHAPFPTDSSFPFQPVSGIHTSILISESPVGLNLAATRQNAGRFLKASAPRPPCVVKPPGGTCCASVIVVLGRFRFRTLSHIPPAAAIESNNAISMVLLQSSYLHAKFAASFESPLPL